MHRQLILTFSFVFALALVPIAPATSLPTLTTTVIEAPNRSGLRDTMPLRIQVTNEQGAAAPPGSIRLQDDRGQWVGSFPLQPTEYGGHSWAIIEWRAESLGLHQLRAVYVPDSPDFSPSSSTLAGIFVEERTPAVVLRMPDRFTVHTKANLTALVDQTATSGSAVLQVNNLQVYNSTQVNPAGEVLFPWTPTKSGQYTLVVNYTNFAGSDWGQVRQSVLVTHK